MQNTRALYLLNKKDLTESDREFLKKHLELWTDVFSGMTEELYTCQSENATLKDTIDYGKFIDDQYRRAVESLVALWKTQPEREECLTKLKEILDILIGYDGNHSSF